LQQRGILASHHSNRVEERMRLQKCQLPFETPDFSLKTDVYTRRQNLNVKIQCQRSIRIDVFEHHIAQAIILCTYKARSLAAGKHFDSVLDHPVAKAHGLKRDGDQLSVTWNIDIRLEKIVLDRYDPWVLPIELVFLLAERLEQIGLFLPLLFNRCFQSPLVFQLPLLSLEFLTLLLLGARILADLAFFGLRRHHAQRCSHGLVEKLRLLGVGLTDK